MTERQRVIGMTDEEARNWIYEFSPDTPEFIRRYNVVNWDCAMTRAGFDINRPIKSGELICTCD